MAGPEEGGRQEYCTHSFACVCSIVPLEVVVNLILTLTLTRPHSLLPSFRPMGLLRISQGNPPLPYI